MDRYIQESHCAVIPFVHKQWLEGFEAFLQRLRSEDKLLASSVEQG